MESQINAKNCVTIEDFVVGKTEQQEIYHKIALNNSRQAITGEEVHMHTIRNKLLHTYIANCIKNRKLFKKRRKKY